MNDAYCKTCARFTDRATGMCEDCKVRGVAPLEGRSREVTEMIADWIINDGDHIESAVEAAQMGDAQSVAAVRILVTRILRTARRNTAAREVADEMSANDYDRVLWGYVTWTLCEYRKDNER
ncbi:hypothetical protein ACFYU5_19260 [Nocardia aobensis]|uniref:Uncharacterized protein n=1 Tax=Nocardia aobensis TaxID=257277 RepID=A0ABW6P5X4_9NOCA